MNDKKNLDALESLTLKFEILWDNSIESYQYVAYIEELGRGTVYSEGNTLFEAIHHLSVELPEILKAIREGQTNGY